jgi:thioredoxin reductase
MKRTIWDVIIVGGGPAGRSAAIVLARCNRSVLLIDEGKYRNKKTGGIRNFLTRDNITPADFVKLTDKELDKYKIKRKNARVVKAKALQDKGFEITDNKKITYLCRRILLATGVTDIIPGIPGVAELWGVSVFHCPFCDGWEARDKIIGVFAHKHNGYALALTLSRLSQQVIVFTNGSRNLGTKQRADLAAHQIQVVSKPVEQLVKSRGKLAGVLLKNGDKIACDVLFANDGHTVNAELMKQLGCNCTDKGAAITNKRQETSTKGVYVAGDASFDMHFVVVAAAEGAKAAVTIHNDLLKTDEILV